MGFFAIVSIIVIGITVIGKIVIGKIVVGMIILGIIVTGNSNHSATATAVRMSTEQMWQNP